MRLEDRLGSMLDRLLNHGHVLKCGPRSWRTKTAVPTAGATVEVGAQAASLRCPTLRSTTVKPGDPAAEKEILRLRKKIAENAGS